MAKRPPKAVTGKLRRAVAQTNQLDGRMARFIRDQYDFPIEGNPPSPFRRMVVRINKPMPFVRWAITVGEITHNLHSALDQLAYALAGTSAGDHTAFPITSSPQRWKDMLATGKGKRNRGSQKRLPKVEGMHPDAIDIIKDLQPHPGRGNDLLGILRDLSDWDKHRVPQLATARFKTAKVTFDGIRPGIDSVRILNQHTGRVEDGTTLMDFELTSASGYREVDVYQEIVIAVIFGDGTAAKDRPVVGVLFEVAEFINGSVIEPLRPFLPTG